MATSPARVSRPRYLTPAAFLLSRMWACIVAQAKHAHAKHVRTFSECRPTSTRGSSEEEMRVRSRVRSMACLSVQRPEQGQSKARARPGQGQGKARASREAHQCAACLR